MAPITALADETLHMVFTHVNSTKHVAQCRLVCRRFNVIAEMVMFNCPVNINTASQALSLLQHLAKCQRKGITYFHWGLWPNSSWTSTLLKHLLPVILTSKTVSLTGVIQGQECYDLMNEIAERLDEKPRLIAFPHPTEPNEQYYRQVAKYKNSLQSVYVYMDDMDDFDKDYIRDILDYPKLKSLVIKGETIFLTDMLEFVNKPQLEKLDLDFMTIDDLWESKEETYEWLEANVEQSNTMKRLTVTGDCPACYMESLAYMYPQLESVLIIVCKQHNSAFHQLGAEMDRIMDFLGNLSLKELVFTSIGGFLFSGLVVYFKNHGHEVRVPVQQTGSSIRMIVGNLH